MIKYDLTFSQIDNNYNNLRISSTNKFISIRSFLCYMLRFSTSIEHGLSHRDCISLYLCIRISRLSDRYSFRLPYFCSTRCSTFWNEETLALVFVFAEYELLSPIDHSISKNLKSTGKANYANSVNSSNLLVFFNGKFFSRENSEIRKNTVVFSIENSFQNFRLAIRKEERGEERCKKFTGVFFSFQWKILR